MHKAAYKGHDALCRWLIGNTALGCCQDTDKHNAEEEPRADSTGENFECCIGYRRDAGGYTPAMIAREQGHEALAEWLQSKQDESAGRCVSSQGFHCERQTELKVPIPGAVRATGTAKKMQLTGPLGKLEQVVSVVD